MVLEFLGEAVVMQRGKQGKRGKVYSVVIGLEPPCSSIDRFVNECQVQDCNFGSWYVRDGMSTLVTVPSRHVSCSAGC